MGLCLSVSVSVSVSVCLSQVGVLLKRLNGSHKQNHTIADCQRSPRNSTGVTPYGGTKVGWVKIGDFRQITVYISKTVQDRHIVSIKVE